MNNRNQLIGSLIKLSGILLLTLALIQCVTVPQTSSTSVSNLAIEQVKIINLANQQQLTAQQLIADLAKQDIILVGEYHDSITHHQIEQWLVTQLSQTKPKISFAMEMLTTDNQAKINKVKQWLQSKPRVRQQRIAELIDWDMRWGLTLYGDLLEQLMSIPQPLYGANLTKNEIDTACKQDFALTGENSITQQARNYIKQIIASSHGKNLDEQTLKCRVNIQQLKDRRMSEVLLKSDKPVLLLAGNYHVNKLLGIPLHLKDLAPKIKFKTLAIVDAKDHIDYQQADYVWYAN